MKKSERDKEMGLSLQYIAGQIQGIKERIKEVSHVMNMSIAQHE